MGTEKPPKSVSFDGPVKYRICVNGKPLFDWSDRLNGMSINPSHPDSLNQVTVLEGWLADQGALSGVLNTLYDLQLSLLTVEALTDQPDSTARNVSDGLGDKSDSSQSKRWESSFRERDS